MKLILEDAKITEKEKMLIGQLYDAACDELAELRRASRKVIGEYNKTTAKETDRRKELLKGHFGSCRDNIFIEPAFYCNYRFNIFVGENFTLISTVSFLTPLRSE